MLCNLPMAEWQYAPRAPRFGRRRHSLDAAKTVGADPPAPRHAHGPENDPMHCQIVVVRAPQTKRKSRFSMQKGTQAANLAAHPLSDLTNGDDERPIAPGKIAPQRHRQAPSRANKAAAVLPWSWPISNAARRRPARALRDHLARQHAIVVEPVRAGEQRAVRARGRARRGGSIASRRYRADCTG